MRVALQIVYEVSNRLVKSRIGNLKRYEVTLPLIKEEKPLLPAKA
jgi:hypothetical protein